MPGGDELGQILIKWSGVAPGNALYDGFELSRRLLSDVGATVPTDGGMRLLEGHDGPGDRVD